MPGRNSGPNTRPPRCSSDAADRGSLHLHALPPQATHLLRFSHGGFCLWLGRRGRGCIPREDLHRGMLALQAGGTTTQGGTESTLLPSLPPHSDRTLKDGRTGCTGAVCVRVLSCRLPELQIALLTTMMELASRTRGGGGGGGWDYGGQN